MERESYDWDYTNKRRSNKLGFFLTERAIPAILLRCLLLRAKIDSNPAPNAGQLNFLQLNCNSIKNKHEVIQQHSIDHNIHIAALQESKLSKSFKTPVFRDYAIYRKDRGNGRGGGLIKTHPQQHSLQHNVTTRYSLNCTCVCVCWMMIEIKVTMNGTALILHNYTTLLHMLKCITGTFFCFCDVNE
ncbi:hypothetical protein HELRODRAFT_177595 [Helobdella robusta]|uniref:Endonuclease/exonuclease/phosphatase domain-containing protein n=1 Tax=Helobdella robusta TaxID=6412 RepID=T1FBX1_HELRO|nr:hypothetical protein HELRODRAFT_177595 [Helobdella robusta]ESN97932.1 hypothetical protein HELRODRAFT_177595 [Helobdella robusta]